MNNKDKDTAYVARVHGRVQGVGFRYSARNQAIRLQLKGWVRNEADGTVTVEMEGPEAACLKFLSWLEQGPPGAMVRRVESRKMPYRGMYRSFTVEF